MSALPPTLLEHLSQSLSSFPGAQHFSLQVVRSQPRRSHALFPHATNIKTKVWQEEVLVVLSQRLEVPVAASAEQSKKDEPASAEAAAATANEQVAESASAAAQPAPPAETAAPPSAVPPAPAAAVAAPVATRLAFVAVCAIEASIYSIPATRTSLLYISKVDTTGLGTSLISPTRSLVSSFLSYHLLHPLHATTRLRVHIFAKSQPQYLFPGSMDNSTKHILDDKALMRWWKQTIAQAARDPAVLAAGAKAAPELFYLVPGYSYADSLPYLPDNQSAEGPKWTYGHPYSKLGSPLDPPGASPSASPPPITDLIPAFPDDPKARFLTSLGSSSIASSGTEGDYDDVMLSLSSAQFTTGQTSAQKAAEVEQTRERERGRMKANVQGGADDFWVLMEGRQECCAAALVGFFVVARGESESDQAIEEAAEVKRPTKVAGSLPHRLFTTLWSQFHNVDYAKPALAKCAQAADKWREDVRRVVKVEVDASAGAGGAKESQPAPQAAAGESAAPASETVVAETRDAVYATEVYREIVTSNPEYERKKREAVEAPKVVNMLAPRKKKPKV